MNTVTDYTQHKPISYSITKEECDKLDHEYEINDMIVYLTKAAAEVGGNTSINDAIEQLYKKTRFADEVKSQLYNSNTLASL